MRTTLEKVAKEKIKKKKIGVIKDMEMLEMAHRPPFLYFVIWWKSFSNRALLIVYEIFFKRLILHKTRSYPIPFLVIVTVRDTECLMVRCLSCRWEGKRRELGWTEGKLFTAPLFYYQRAIMLQLPSTSPPQTSHPPPPASTSPTLNRNRTTRSQAERRRDVSSAPQ